MPRMHDEIRSDTVSSFMNSNTIESEEKSIGGLLACCQSVVLDGESSSHIDVESGLPPRLCHWAFVIHVLHQVARYA